jgi:uncharacterized protein YukE
VWEDEAQKIFAGHFEKFRQDVVKFNEALSSYLLMMRKSVDDFARVDSALYDVLK